MANVKITALEHLSSTQAAPEDVFVIDHVGPLITKKITLSNVTRYLTNVTGNAKIVESNLNNFASYANANAAALSLAISNISANFSIAGDVGTDVVVVGSETLTFTGQYGISTQVAPNEVIVRMIDTGVTPGIYGGMDGTTIKVPSITVDTQGRITLAQNTNVIVDFSSVQANIDIVQSNLTSIGNNLQANIDSVQSNLVSTAGNLNNLVTTDKSNLVAAINELSYTGNYFDSIETARFTFQGVTVNNVSSLGAVIFSEDKANVHFAKLLINVEDLTYGQYQSSELLLLQDTADIKVVEYAMIYTSTNPLVTYEASFVGSNVELFATATSANNRINVLKIIN
jgi:hypothetical protein